MSRSEVVSIDFGKDLLKMVDQRAKQEGVNRSQYVREAIVLEMFFSGDLEAMGFVAKRIGKRMKSMMLDKLASVDLQERIETLAVE